MRKHQLDNDEIVRLYVEEGLRARGIARQFRVGDDVIYRVLEDAGVKRSARAHIPLEQAIRLYVQDGWPAYKIGQKFGVTGSTVVRHLRQAGVVIRNPVESRQPAGRRPCPRSVVFRAYLLGLVWGDFAVRTHSDKGQTISVTSSTTRPEQVDLIREVFEPFGPVYQWAGSFRASLDLSFSFLSVKYERRIPDWLRGIEARAAFAAGYVDAEGSFGVYEGRARFKLDSYDCEVLAWLHRWCQGVGIRSRLRCVARAGSPRPDGGAFRCDLWRVNVNEGLSMLRFVATLEPYVRHAGRRADAERARRNVLERLRSRIGDQLEPLPLVAGPHRPRQEHAC